jgi:hypothetical protein
MTVQHAAFVCLVNVSNGCSVIANVLVQSSLGGASASKGVLFTISISENAPETTILMVKHHAEGPIRSHFSGFMLKDQVFSFLGFLSLQRAWASQNGAG